MNEMDELKNLGFSDGGALSSRSVMMPELITLLGIAPKRADATCLEYLTVQDNVLHKASAANRSKTFAFLRRLYGLNLELAVFREFSRLYELFPNDVESLAASLAFAREPLTRACAGFVMSVPIGREDFESWIREYAPGRYAQTMYVSFSHKLAKAEALKVQLEAIAQGEKPFDIFVRWKPLAQQPIGWEPDLNYGVRMNIRPFVEAGVLRIPRAKLGVHWKSDRGKDVASAPWFKLVPTYDEPEGTRINDHHLSLAEKQAAREKAATGRAK